MRGGLLGILQGRLHSYTRPPRHADPLQGQFNLKDWPFAIAKRSTMPKARVALARRLGIITHAMLRDRTQFVSA